MAKVLVERNVVFGMVSGLALLLDVHHPRSPVGIGILFVGGSGWESAPGYDATGLKDKENQLQGWLPALLDSGYTVFSINHRAAPRFPYPAALDDMRRAIRFVRSHSADYGINPERIGAFGGSSGGHLACLAAMKASKAQDRAHAIDIGGPKEDTDKQYAGTGTGDVGSGGVDEASEAIQCLVLREAPTDLWHMASKGDAEGAAYAISFIEGRIPKDLIEPSTSAAARYAAASPITYVSSDSPPTLLIHGDADRTVPYAQSVAMEAAMARAGARVRLLTIPGGIHAPDFGADGKPPPAWPDYLGEMTAWLDKHLAGKRGIAGR